MSHNWPTKRTEQSNGNGGQRKSEIRFLIAKPESNQAVIDENAPPIEMFADFGE